MSTQNNLQLTDKVMVCHFCCKAECKETGKTSLYKSRFNDATDSESEIRLFTTHKNGTTFIHIRTSEQTPFKLCRFCVNGECEKTGDSENFGHFFQDNHLHIDQHNLALYRGFVNGQLPKQTTTTTASISCAKVTIPQGFNWSDQKPVTKILPKPEPVAPKMTVQSLQERRAALLRESEMLAQLIEEETRKKKQEEEAEVQNIFAQFKTWSPERQTKFITFLSTIMGTSDKK